jgi:hypothetical protein
MDGLHDRYRRLLRTAAFTAQRLADQPVIYRSPSEGGLC